MRGLVIAIVVSGCYGDRTNPLPIDAYVALDAPAHAGAGPGGGLLDVLRFAIVGDTRPANLDDTAGYPTATVQQIWTTVEAEVPKTAFAVTTGDYMFASIDGSEAGPQLDLYIGARAAYSGFVYPALGNHECTGFTASNCGPSGADGNPPNYTLFMERMIQPIGEVHPYYVERFAAPDASWSAKIVFVAANAWSIEQGRWLEAILGETSTYTFVVRHEPDDATTAPGVRGSQVVMAKHPVTLLVAGHAHTYRRDAAHHAIIVGNGGAPLSGDASYGYVLVERQPDGTLQLTSYESATHTVVEQFRLTADGLDAP